MSGGKNRYQTGYTIIEVMIFLAVSGFMFVLAASFISGKQAEVDFRQSMNNINSKLNGIINQVSNGENPTYANLKCVGSSSGPQIGSGSQTQGTNGGQPGSNYSGCIYLGEVLQFNVDGDSTKYNTYVIAANQHDGFGSAVTSFATAFPVAVDNNCQGNCHSTINMTQSAVLDEGLELKHIVECQPTIAACQPGTNPIAPLPAEIGAFGFFGSFSGGVSQSGAQSVLTAIVPGTPAVFPGVTHETAMVDALNNALHTMKPDTDYVGSGSSKPNAFILLCFKNGARVGSIAIGGSQGQQLATDEQLGNGVPNVCYA